MDYRKKRHAALYMLISLVDSNNGCINVNSESVKRVFNDEEDIVRIEYANGKTSLLADADFETMNDVILKCNNQID